MASPQSKQRRTRPDDRALRQAILSATEDLLAERRFDEFSVADILEAADVSRSSFYFYFESKHAVLVELVRSAFGEATESSRGWLDDGADGSLQEVLAGGVRVSLEIWRTHFPVFGAVVENWRSDPELTRLWLEIMDGFAADVATRIQKDRDRGVAPNTRVSPKRLATLLTWMGERAFYLAAINHPGFDDEEKLIDAISDIWLAVMYGQRPEEGS